MSMIKSIKEIFVKLRNPRILRDSILAFVGYLLSPLSWWNDAILNIPLALFLAKITSFFIHTNFSLLFTTFYWITNVIGFILMYIGGEDIVAGKKNVRKNKRALLISILISTIYTLVVVEVLRLMFH